MPKPKTEICVIKENGEIFLLFRGAFQAQEMMPLKKFRQAIYHTGYYELASLIVKILKSK